MPCSTKYTRNVCSFAANMTYLTFPVNISVSMNIDHTKHEVYISI